MIAFGYVSYRYTGVLAAWPNGNAGATPPAWLPIVVGIVSIAFPHLVWLHDKRPEAQVSDITAICAWVFGAALVVYGMHLWL